MVLTIGLGMLGAYLHGSAVLGGPRPASDLDILVVIERPTTARERRALVEGLLEVSGARARRRPVRPVELSVVVESDVRPRRYPPHLEFWALAQRPPEHQPPLAQARDMYL